MRLLRSGAFLLTLITLGCSSGGGDGSGGNTTDGEALYRMPHSDGNSFACANCHALSEPAPDGFLRPGHPIGDATKRASFKNGQITELREAVNTCRVEWMVATPYEADDPNWLALEGYLASQAPAGDAEPISYEIVQPPVDLMGGDPMEGQEVFNTRCIVCHGTDAAGTIRAPQLVGDLLDAETIGRRVRTSGSPTSPTYNGLTGGRMPFWSADRLSDAELVDIVAFVLGNAPPVMGPDAGPPMDAGPSNCGSTHPKIGQTAQLSTFAHQVSGTATIVDDCTIEVSMFNFDGTGIDVRFYGGLGGDYDNGFSMSGDLRRSGGYQGETVRATLPDGQTLDDLDGISVWCVPVGVSFGDGQFGP